MKKGHSPGKTLEQGSAGLSGICPMTKTCPVPEGTCPKAKGNDPGTDAGPPDTRHQPARAVDQERFP
jgi:hypothetical protein